jgi:hypothetical protein
MPTNSRVDNNNEDPTLSHELEDRPMYQTRDTKTNNIGINQKRLPIPRRYIYGQLALPNMTRGLSKAPMMRAL